MTASEDGYQHARTPAERRRIQGEVIARYRDRLARFVKVALWSPHLHAEAIQVGLIGLLVALEKWDPEHQEHYDDGAFFGFATMHIRNEIRKWLDHGVNWRPTARTRKQVDHPEHKQPSEFCDEVHAQDGDDPETQAAHSEALERLRPFLAALSDEDRHLMLCAKRDRGGADSPRRQRYRELLQRVKAHFGVT